MSHYKDVKKFHEKFGLIVGDHPQQLTHRKLQERVEFMQEELNEFIEGKAERNLAKQADALVDLVYVALGTAVMLGLPWKELWDDVQRANMSKERGFTHRGHTVDVCKPKGWKPPKTWEILRGNGYSQWELEVDDPEHLQEPEAKKINMEDFLRVAAPRVDPFRMGAPSRPNPLGHLDPKTDPLLNPKELYDFDKGDES